jgi:cephalosporin hydroxylase
MIYFESTPEAATDYLEEKKLRISRFATDCEFKKISREWRQLALQRKYMNNFSWMGRPLIQLPTDIIAIQEIIWKVQPDLIIETGIAHGGSVLLSASMLDLVGNGEVIGIDVEIRPHNREAIEKHPSAKRVHLIEGSSTDGLVVEQVRDLSRGKSRILVFLDSNHTHDHVLSELKAYGPLVTKGSYLVVFDTFVEDLPSDYVWQDRPWGKGNNPKTAVDEWLASNQNFVVDSSIEDRLLITSAPGGFLYRIQ